MLTAAQAYAQRRGQPLDALVAEWLQATVQPPPAPAQPRPLSARVRRLYGALKLPADFDYKAELGEALDERFGA